MGRCIFSYLNEKRKTETVCTHKEQTRHTLTVLSDATSTLQPSVIISRTDHEFQDITRNIVLIHYIESIFLIEQGDKEVASFLEALVKKKKERKNTCPRSWG